MAKTIDFAQYARNMRLNLTDPQQIHENGDINHQYFLVKKGTYWSENEDQKLITFLESQPLGQWQPRNVLTQFTDVELELRTCILLKISDISQYQGQTFTKQQILEIADNNEKIGKQKKKFKNNIYEI